MYCKRFCLRLCAIVAGLAISLSASPVLSEPIVPPGLDLAGDDFAIVSGAPESATVVPNPSLTHACGLDVVLVLDISGSIDQVELAQMRTAAKVFVNAFLPATPSKIAIVLFSTEAGVLHELSGDASSLINTIDTQITITGGQTNWKEGLNKARGILEGPNDRDDTKHPDLIVMLTDGEPTVPSLDPVGAAITEANLSKTSTSGLPIRIVGVGIGLGDPPNLTFLSNLEDITGTHVHPPEPITQDIDVILGDFVGLADILSEFAASLCAATITVNKILDADGNCNTTADQTSGPGFTFTPSVTGGVSRPASGETDSEGLINFDLDFDAPGGTVSVNLCESIDCHYKSICGSCEGATNNGTFNVNAHCIQGIVLGTTDVVRCTFYNSPDVCDVPPISNPGGPYEKQCGGATTNIQLDGSASVDPNGDPITYSWTSNCLGATFNDSHIANPILTLTSVPGCNVECQVTLCVTDGTHPPVCATTSVHVVDTINPVIQCPPNMTVVRMANVPPPDFAGGTATDNCDVTPAVTHKGDTNNGGSGCPGSPLIITRTYRATDDCGRFVECQQTITVEGNSPPVISEGDGPITRSVKRVGACNDPDNRFELNATDADGQLASLVWSVVPGSGPTNGVVTLSSTSTPGRIRVCYRPNGGSCLPDSFVVKVTDTCGGSDTIQVNITITNQPPNISQGASIPKAVVEDSTCPSASNTIVLSATDADTPLTLLKWSISDPPDHGQISVITTYDGATTSLCYQPNPDYFNNPPNPPVDVFEVRVDDDCGGSDTILINVTVTGVNDCPRITTTAPADMTVDEDSDCSHPENLISLHADDVDSPGSSLVWSLLGPPPPTKGVVTFPNGTVGSDVVVCYTPFGDCSGDDSFIVQVSDSKPICTGGGPSTILVNVHITPKADCPVIDGLDTINITIQEDSVCSGPMNTRTLTATDADDKTCAGGPQTTFTWSILSAPSKGQTSFPGGNTGASVQVCYVPNPNCGGEDTFKVQVSDGQCADVVTVNVTITPVVDCPHITTTQPVDITVFEDSGCNQVALSASDADLDPCAAPTNATLTWTILTQALKGGATFQNNINTGPNIIVCYQPNANCSGNDSFVVQVSDGTCGVSNATVNVHITPTNDCPLIDQGDSIAMNVVEDSDCNDPLNIRTLSASDADFDKCADGPPQKLTWSVGILPANKGTVSFPNGDTGESVEICYVPSPDCSGVDSFTIEVTDGACTETIEVVVKIEEINDCPEMKTSCPASLTVAEDSHCPSESNSLVLSAFDPDSACCDCNNLIWSIQSQGQKGVATILTSTNANTITVCYEPNANCGGTDSFVVAVTDGECEEVKCSVSVTITGSNDCPTIDGPASVPMLIQEDSTCASPGNTVHVTATDLDALPCAANPQGAVLTWSVLPTECPPPSSPQHKGVVSFPTGNTGAGVDVCYTPNPNANGHDCFRLQVSDGICTDEVTYEVEIGVSCDPPDITNVSAALSVQEDSLCPNPANEVTLNAIDPDSTGAQLTWSLLTPPTKGTVIGLVPNPTGNSVTVCYQPFPNCNGTDSFVVRVTDDCQLHDDISVAVTINALNDCPIIGIPELADLNMTVLEGSTCADPANSRVLVATDDDDIPCAGGPSTTFTWSLVSGPSKGGVTFPNGTTIAQLTFCYTPGPDCSGTDTFVLSVTDGTCPEPDTVTVHVTIASLPDCPRITTSQPAMTVGEDSTCSGTGNTIVLTAEDDDQLPCAGGLGADTLTWSIIQEPGKGKASFPLGQLGNSVVVCYTPDPNCNGTDSFEVKVCDQNCGCATIIIPVTINSVNDCPQIEGDRILAIDIQEDSGCDGAQNTRTFCAIDPDVANNCSSEPSDVLTWSFVSPAPAKGTVSFVGSNVGTCVQVCYVPNPDCGGSDSFQVRVSDGTCDDTVTVNVNINNVVDCPQIATSQPSMTVDEDSNCAVAENILNLVALDGDLNPCAADPGSVQLNWSIGTQPTFGTVSFQNGSTGPSVNICYTPFPDYFGNDSFRVVVSDGTCDPVSVVVSVVVRPICDPVFICEPGLVLQGKGSACDPDGTFEGGIVGTTVQEDSHCGDSFNTVTLHACDPDGEGSIATWSIASPPIHGTAVFVGGNNTGSTVQVCYEPAADYNGLDWFDVSVTDGECTDPPAIVRVCVTIVPGNDCPILTAPGGSLNLSTQEDSTCSRPENTITASATDMDAADVLEWSVVQDPAHGTITFPNGLIGPDIQICYTPSPNFFGTDVFKVQVSDGNCEVPPVLTVNVNVQHVCEPDELSIHLGDSFNLTVQRNSTCSERGNRFMLSASGPEVPCSLLFWSADLPTKGTVTFPAGNNGCNVQVCYTPNPGASGQDHFVVTVVEKVQDSICTDSININVSIECGEPSGDCNDNGTPDACEIEDCKGDPDCSDCNDNGIPDSCDIDQCKGDPDCGDCNDNGVPDGCDIDQCEGDAACGDCNENGIPDGCDIDECDGDPACGDCNGNGVPDGCDINQCDGDPACDDCNDNGIPDSCDIASCNGDPACEDCNGNGVPDGCDIDNGVPDCNENGVPDTCDIGPGGGSNDCNGNTIPDECEIEPTGDTPGGPFFCTENCADDCNANGVPDECDSDQDGDGIPDDCDNCVSVANPDQADGDSDSVGDACDNCAGVPNTNQADADNDGIGDACDEGPPPQPDTGLCVNGLSLLFSAVSGAPVFVPCDTQDPNSDSSADAPPCTGFCGICSGTLMPLTILGIMQMRSRVRRVETRRRQKRLPGGSD
jgi:VCBS repeat-containing protein